MGTSPPQQHQAERSSPRSPKTKRERSVTNKELEKNEAGTAHTSSPKPQREKFRIKEKNEMPDKPNKASNAEGAGSIAAVVAQQPSPMSRVTRLDSGWVRAALGSCPDNQHSDKKDCGCHACIRELAVIKFQPTDRKKNFPEWFREHVGNLQIYSHTELDSHPESCLCKTHLEKEWRASSSGSTDTTPTPPPVVQKKAGLVTNILKKLDPSRTGKMSRLPLPTVPAVGHRLGGNRTSHQDKKLTEESNAAIRRREDPRTGRPPPPPRIPKPVQVERTSSIADSKESEIAKIPVHTTR